jgi:hypothetical protein
MYCGHSVDAHIQNGVVTVSLSLLPILAAKTSVIHNSDHGTVQLPYIEDNKSCTLRSQSF